jgi:hypothetical protein
MASINPSSVSADVLKHSNAEASPWPRGILLFPFGFKCDITYSNTSQIMLWLHLITASLGLKFHFLEPVQAARKHSS